MPRFGSFWSESVCRVPKLCSLRMLAAIRSAEIASTIFLTVGLIGNNSARAGARMSSAANTAHTARWRSRFRAARPGPYRRATLEPRRGPMLRVCFRIFVALICDREASTRSRRKAQPLAFTVGVQVRNERIGRIVLLLARHCEMHLPDVLQPRR